MSKRETFLMCVFSGALAMDMEQDSANAQLIARIACSIPEEKIPHCPMNAAKVFLAYSIGRTDRPFDWMLSAFTSQAPGRSLR